MAVLYSYDFSATAGSLPPSWSWIRQSAGGSYSEGAGVGTIADSAGDSGNPNWNAIGVLLGGLDTGDYTVVAKVDSAATGIAVGLRSSTGHKTISIFVKGTACSYACWPHLETAGTYPDFGGVSGPTGASAWTHIRIVRHYIGVADSHYDLAVSTDGVTWTTIITNWTAPFGYSDPTYDQLWVGIDKESAGAGAAHIDSVSISTAAAQGTPPVLYQFDSQSVTAISLATGLLVNVSPAIDPFAFPWDGLGFCSVGPDGRVYVWGTNALGPAPWWASIDPQLEGPWVAGPDVDEPSNTWVGGASFIGESIVAVGDNLRVPTIFEFVGMQFPDLTVDSHTSIAVADLDGEGDVRTTYSSTSYGDALYFASGGRWAHKLTLGGGFTRTLDSWVVAGEPMVIVAAAFNPGDGRVYAYGVNGAGVTGNPSATDALISSAGGTGERVEKSWVSTLTYDEGYGYQSSMVIDGDYIYIVTQNDVFVGGIIHRYQISTGTYEEHWTHVAEGQICGVGLLVNGDPTIDLTGSLLVQLRAAVSLLPVVSTDPDPLP